MAYAFGAPSIVQDGLVFYIDAANKDSYLGSGTTVSSISNPTGSNIGTMQQSGMFDSNNAGVFAFDSTDDYITVPDSAAMRFNNNVTLSAWIYPTTTDSYRNILNKRGTGQQYSFFLINDNRLDFDDGSSHIYTTATISPNVWTNVVASVSAGSLDFYINGKLDSSGQSANPTEDTNITYIGRKFNGTNIFAGEMGPIMIYHRGLSASEVAQNYNALKGRFI